MLNTKVFTSKSPNSPAMLIIDCANKKIMPKEAGIHRKINVARVFIIIVFPVGSSKLKECGLAKMFPSASRTISVRQQCATNDKKKKQLFIRTNEDASAGKEILESKCALNKCSPK